MNNNENGTSNNFTGWTKWADLVSKTVDKIENDVVNLQKELRDLAQKISTEINLERTEMINIKITLEELKRMNDKISNIKEDVVQLQPLLRDVEILKTLVEALKSIPKMQEDITTLKVKSGLWGGLSGIATSVATGLIYFLMKK